jgi:hypothetical protein
MPDASNGVTLTYAAPTPLPRTASIKTIEGGFRAIIPALPAWARLTPRAVELLVTLALATGALWVAAFIGRDLGPSEPIVYLVWLLAAAGAATWWRIELRSFVSACRFGHFPTVITATASALSIEYAASNGLRQEDWDAGDLADVQVTRAGTTLTLCTMLRLTATGRDWLNPFTLRLIAPDRRFADELQRRLSRYCDTLPATGSPPPSGGSLD